MFSFSATCVKINIKEQRSQALPEARLKLPSFGKFEPVAPRVMRMKSPNAFD
jgi:hypothetical protein